MARKYSSREEMEREYKKLAKKADRRLRDIEAFTDPTSEKYDSRFKNTKAFAYKRAMKDISKWSGEGVKRFDTKAPANYQSLQAKINDIENFLNAPTSTRAGIKRVYMKGAKSTNEKYGTNFKWQDLALLYESGEMDRLFTKYGSATVLRSIGVMQKNKRKVEKAIEEQSASTMFLDDDLIVNEIAKELTSQGLSPDAILNKASRELKKMERRLKR